MPRLVYIPPNQTTGDDNADTPPNRMNSEDEPPASGGASGASSTFVAGARANSTDGPNALAENNARYLGETGVDEGRPERGETDDVVNNNSDVDQDVGESDNRSSKKDLDSSEKRHEETAEPEETAAEEKTVDNDNKLQPSDTTAGKAPEDKLKSEEVVKTAEPEKKSTANNGSNTEPSSTAEAPDKSPEDKLSKEVMDSSVEKNADMDETKELNKSEQLVQVTVKDEQSLKQVVDTLTEMQYAHLDESVAPGKNQSMPDNAVNNSEPKQAEPIEVVDTLTEMGHARLDKSEEPGKNQMLNDAGTDEPKETKPDLKIANEEPCHEDEVKSLEPREPGKESKGPTVTGTESESVVDALHSKEPFTGTEKESMLDALHSKEPTVTGTESESVVDAPITSAENERSNTDAVVPDRPTEEKDAGTNGTKQQDEKPNNNAPKVPEAPVKTPESVLDAPVKSDEDERGSSEGVSDTPTEEKDDIDGTKQQEATPDSEAPVKTLDEPSSTKEVMETKDPVENSESVLDAPVTFAENERGSTGGVVPDTPAEEKDVDTNGTKQQEATPDHVSKAPVKTLDEPSSTKEVTETREPVENKPKPEKEVDRAAPSRRQCEVEGCVRYIRQNRMCTRHFNEWNKAGAQAAAEFLEQKRPKLSGSKKPELKNSKPVDNGSSVEGLDPLPEKRAQVGAQEVEKFKPVEANIIVAPLRFQCQVNGCTNYIHQNCLCLRHFNEVMRLRNSFNAQSSTQAPRPYPEQMLHQYHYLWYPQLHQTLPPNMQHQTAGRFNEQKPKLHDGRDESTEEPKTQRSKSVPAKHQCIVEGCTRYIRRNQRCQRHLKLHGQNNTEQTSDESEIGPIGAEGGESTSPAIKRVNPVPIKRQCNVSGCTRYIYRKRMCTRHFNELSKPQAPSIEKPELSDRDESTEEPKAQRHKIAPAHRRCTVEGCTRYIHRNRMCLRHEKMHEENGTTQTSVDVEAGGQAHKPRKRLVVGEERAASEVKKKKSVPIERQCTVEGCARYIHRKRLCRIHFRLADSEDNATDHHAVTESKKQLSNVAPAHRQCTSDGCQKYNLGNKFNNMCLKHFNEWKMSEESEKTSVSTEKTKPDSTTEPKTKSYKPAPLKRQCTVDGCMRYIFRKRLCHRHFTAEHRDAIKAGKKPEKKTPKPAPADRQCTMEGCVQQIERNQMCSSHYKQWIDQTLMLIPVAAAGKRGLESNENERPKQKKAKRGNRKAAPAHLQCKVEGCVQYLRRKRMCLMHFNQSREQAGMTQKTKQLWPDSHRVAPNHLQCKVTGCVRYLRHKGMCSKHFSELGKDTAHSPTGHRNINNEPRVALDPMAQNPKPSVVETGVNRQFTVDGRYSMCERLFRHFRQASSLQKLLSSSVIAPVHLQCKVEGCSAYHHGKKFNQLCLSHFLQQQNASDKVERQVQAGGGVENKPQPMEEEEKEPRETRSKIGRHCKIEGCPKFHCGSKNDYMCRRHYRESLNPIDASERGTEHQENTETSDKTVESEKQQPTIAAPDISTPSHRQCVVEGCLANHLGRKTNQMCLMHFDESLKRKLANDGSEKCQEKASAKSNRQCVVEGCVRYFKGKKYKFMCPRHFKHFYPTLFMHYASKGGEALEKIQTPHNGEGAPPKRQCKVEGCTRYHGSTKFNFMCQRHYKQSLKDKNENLGGDESQETTPEHHAKDDEENQEVTQDDEENQEFTLDDGDNLNSDVNSNKSLSPIEALDDTTNKDDGGSCDEEVQDSTDIMQIRRDRRLCEVEGCTSHGCHNRMCRPHYEEWAAQKGEEKQNSTTSVDDNLHFNVWNEWKVIQ